MRTIIGLLVLTAVIGGSGFWYMKTHTGPRTTFNVAEVHRGHLEATVGSTGTLQPREVVDVGAQVVGRIISIGKDHLTPSPASWTGVRRWWGPNLDKDGKLVKLGTVLAGRSIPCCTRQRGTPPGPR